MVVSLTGHFRSCNGISRGLLGAFALTVGLQAPLEAARKKPRPPKPVAVRDIYVEVKDVFDPKVPGEDIWPFRAANALHLKTKAAVIRRELLVEPGSQSDTVQLEESERILRALPFIKDATITPKANPDGTMDLMVETQDSWTTQPQLNVSSEGNETTMSAGFEEVNLLGYGKYLSYFYKEDADGISHQVGYKDPQFLRTRWRLTSLFEDIPTGNTESVFLDHPFYSFTTRVAGGLPFDHFQKREEVFENGVEISRYDRETLKFRPYAGLWVNNDPMNALRVNFTYRYAEDNFTPEAGTLPGTMPDDQALSGPILGTTFTQSNFVKETFIDRTGRVEDINLGHEVALGLGYVERGLGATENSVPFNLNHSFGSGGDADWFSLFNYGMSSRYSLGTNGENVAQLLNTIYFVNVNAYRHLLRTFPMTGVIHAESAYIQRPDIDNLLTIGGNAGLRGFPNDTQTGNKSILFNVENRLFYPKELFHLAYIGGAVFLDTGQVQPEGRTFTSRDMKANIGVGMRFGLSRSAEGTVFRVDLAYAVGSVDQSNRWILSVSSGQGFKRTANTYKNFANYSTTQ